MKSMFTELTKLLPDSSKKKSNLDDTKMSYVSKMQSRAGIEATKAIPFAKTACKGIVQNKEEQERNNAMSLHSERGLYK